MFALVAGLLMVHAQFLATLLQCAIFLASPTRCVDVQGRGLSMLWGGRSLHNLPYEQGGSTACVGMTYNGSCNDNREDGFDMQRCPSTIVHAEYHQNGRVCELSVRAAQPHICNRCVGHWSGVDGWHNKGHKCKRV